MMHGQGAGGAVTLKSVVRDPPGVSRARLPGMSQSLEPRRASLPHTEIVTERAEKPAMSSINMSPGDAS
jgi:hypothetical protein